MNILKNFLSVLAFKYEKMKNNFLRTVYVCWTSNRRTLRKSMIDLYTFVFCLIEEH